MAEQFFQGEQEGWFHDPGYWGGYFHTYNYFSVGAHFNTPRKLHVFLPRDYEVSQNHYPVIYLNDGDTAFFKGGAYQKTWNVASILTRLYLSNQIRKVIVVAVCPINRDYEYTHAPVWDHSWGGLEDYSRYLAQSVKSFIDTHYRTLSEPQNTLILGASHGGLAAFFTALQHPDCFGNVAALSPSFWVGLDSMGEPSSLLNPADALLTSFAPLESSALLFFVSGTLANQEKRPKIYLDWGLVRDGGFHNNFIEERATIRGREMARLLVKKFGYQPQKNLFIVEDEQGEHTEESWSSRLETILKIFFRYQPYLR